MLKEIFDKPSILEAELYYKDFAFNISYLFKNNLSNTVLIRQVLCKIDNLIFENDKKIEVNGHKSILIQLYLGKYEKLKDVALKKCSVEVYYDSNKIIRNLQ